MDFKFDKTFNIFILGLIILSIIAAYPISSFIYSLMDFGKEISYSNSFTDIGKTLIFSLLLNLHRILIGLSFYIFSSRFQHDKISWTIIGFIYGEIALILILMSFILHGLKTAFDFKKYTIQILILFLISFLIRVTLPTIIPILINITTGVIENAKYGVYAESIKYAKYIPIVIFHIALTFRFNKVLIRLGEERKGIWFLSTLFLGLIPIIAYYQLFMTEKKNENAA